MSHVSLTGRGLSVEGVIVAVATQIAGPLHPFGIESWDLTLHGEAFEALSSDPFSFAGEFLSRDCREYERICWN